MAWCYFSIPGNVDFYDGSARQVQVPASVLNMIISRELSASSCRRLLSADGVTSPYLTISPVPGIFPAISVDVRAARDSAPEVAGVSSAAKNLDEYQFLICSLVPSLPDSSPSKLELQKYRIAIFAAFAKLVNILNERQQELGGWIRHARWLIEETSEAYLQAKSDVRLHPARHAEVFDYFGIPEASVNSALRSFYGQ
jgi:hypothetical protein